LAEFAKKSPKLEIRAGIVEGTFYDADGMKTIASIPSREVLLSRLLGSMQSPVTNLARVLNQIAEKGGASDAAVEAAPAAEEAPAQEAPAEEAPAAE
jgi:large subunit ribosomal protein L10